MTEKNQRGKNFSAEEELILVDLIINQRHIFENKKSDAVNWKIKNEAWMKLEETFKRQTGIHRPWKTLKDKYDNIKRKAKMELANEKHETYRTGGGTPSNAKVSAVSEKILSLVGNSATGLYNPFDNDANNNIDEGRMEEEYLDNMGTEFSEMKTKPTTGPSSNGIKFNSSTVSEMKTKPTTGPSSNGVKFNSSTVKQKVSKELFISNKSRKTSMEEEKVKLLKLQQAFYECENSRASEKHKLEIESMKLKNEILAIELREKKEKSVLYM